jgi:hypothetical protein
LYDSTKIGSGCEQKTTAAYSRPMIFVEYRRGCIGEGYGGMTRRENLDCLIGLVFLLYEMFRCGDDGWNECFTTAMSID